MYHGYGPTRGNYSTFMIFKALQLCLKVHNEMILATTVEMIHNEMIHNSLAYWWK